ncbi:MAG: glycosyltransferase family 39 protein [Planctomycetota bacterium]|nr:glycosyltransferase family 39 protein [Planctomycetota bacterium]
MRAWARHPAAFLAGLFLLQIAVCLVFSRRLWPWAWSDGALLDPDVAQNTLASSWQLKAFETPLAASLSLLVQRSLPPNAHYVLNLLGLGAAGALSVATFVRGKQERLACLPVLALLYASSFPVFALQSGSWMGAGAFFFFLSLWLMQRPRGQAAGGAALALAVAVAPAFLIAAPAFLLLKGRNAWAGFAALLAALVAADAAAWKETAARFGGNWRDFYFTETNQAQSLYLGALFHTIPSVVRYLQGWIFVAGKLMGLLLLAVDLLLMIRLRSQPAEERREPAEWMIALSLPVVCMLPFGSHPLLLCIAAPLMPALAAFVTGAGGREKTLLWGAVSASLVLATVRLSGAYATGYQLSQVLLPGVFLFGISGLLLKVASVWRLLEMPWLNALYEQCEKRGSPNLLYLASEVSIAHRAIGLPTGVLLIAACLVVYQHYHFSFSVVCLWLGSLFAFFCVWGGLKIRLRDLSGLALRDWKHLAALVVLFSPAYVYATYAWPYQIATDELSFCGYIKMLMFDRNYDFFRVAGEYFCWPAGCFVFLGLMTQAIGESSLENIRMANGILGVVSICGVYALGRECFSRKYAWLWAALFGCSHSFLVISRMGLRDTIPVLLEIAAMLLLYRGIRRKNSALLFLAGVVAGLGVYNYFSARVIIVLCAAALAWDEWRAGAAALRSWRRRANDIFLRSVPLYVGFLVCASPMALSTYNAGAYGSKYAREQCILYPDARKLITEWHERHDTMAAIAENAVKGLTVFNNNEYDNSYAYVNLKHGFVDPLTGALLWVGVGMACWARRRGVFRRTMLAGFLIIWLVVGILMTRNPAYCRFLVVIPFASYFALEGLRLLARKALRLSRAGFVRAGSWALCAAAVLGIGAWNARIVFNHYRQAVNDRPERVTDIVGNEVASSIRYVRACYERGYRNFLVITDDRQPFQPYGGDFWVGWIKTQVPRNALVVLGRPLELKTEPIQLNIPTAPACVVLMSGEVWRENEAALRRSYPEFKFVPLTLAEGQVALEFGTPEP